MTILSYAEQEQLAAAIVATAETLGQVMSASAAELMAGDLAEHPKEAIVAALRACRREVKGRLTLAEILQRVQQADGHPSADTAWAIAMRAADEVMSVVVTNEIMEALGLARPLLTAGDKFGAGRAFRDGYDRLLAKARSEGRRAHWRLSEGFSPDHRLEAVEEAGRQGLLPPAEVERLAGPLRLQLAAPSAAGIAIAGLVGCDAPSDAPQGVSRERWAELRAEVLAGRERAKAKREAEREAERADLARRKAEAAEALERRQGGAL